jgi:hypothetical protein
MSKKIALEMNLKGMITILAVSFTLSTYIAAFSAVLAYDTKMSPAQITFVVASSAAAALTLSAVLYAAKK